MSCAGVEEEGVAERYVTGQLDEEEAEAFERHFFDCDRCWEEVWRAVGLRSAFEGSRAETGGSQAEVRVSAAEVPGREEGHPPEDREIASGDRAGPPGRGPRGGRRALLPLAAAAVLVLATIGLWQALSDGAGTETGVYRSPEGTVDVSAYTSGDLLVATWGSLEEAERYRVRLYTGEGAVLYDRKTADTSLTVRPEELSPRPEGARLYWRIDALDSLGRVVARSGLRPVAPPSP